MLFFSTGILSFSFYYNINIFFLMEEGINVNKISDNLFIALITFAYQILFKSIPLKVESLSCKIR